MCRLVNKSCIQYKSGFVGEGGNVDGSFGHGFKFSSQTYWALLGMAVVSQIAGHTSYNWALKWFSSSLVAVSLLGEPIGSTIMAYFFFGEGLTVTKVLGGGVILAGIYLAATSAGKKMG